MTIKPIGNQKSGNEEIKDQVRAIPFIVDDKTNLVHDFVVGMWQRADAAEEMFGGNYSRHFSSPNFFRVPSSYFYVANAVALYTFSSLLPRRLHELIVEKRTCSHVFLF